MNSVHVASLFMLCSAACRIPKFVKIEILSSKQEYTIDLKGLKSEFHSEAGVFATLNLEQGGVATHGLSCISGEAAPRCVWRGMLTHTIVPLPYMLSKFLLAHLHFTWPTAGSVSTARSGKQTRHRPFRAGLPRLGRCCCLGPGGGFQQSEALWLAPIYFYLHYGHNGKPHMITKPASPEDHEMPKERNCQFRVQRFRVCGPSFSPPNGAVLINEVWRFLRNQYKGGNGREYSHMSYSLSSLKGRSLNGSYALVYLTLHPNPNSET